MDLVTCEFSTLTSKCECCQESVKKGYLDQDGRFVCSQECAKKMPR